MNKKIKNKVGRPKLADKKLKRESIIVCTFILMVSLIISYFAFQIISIEFNPKYLTGTIYNTHVSSCIINNNVLDCGPNVTYVKYKLDNKDYKELSKKDESIKIKLEKHNNIQYCYKTNTTNLICK